MPIHDNLSQSVHIYLPILSRSFLSISVDRLFMSMLLSLLLTVSLTLFVSIYQSFPDC